jgi:hypothetical protein
MVNVNLVQAKIALGIQKPDELPAIAAELLGLGIVSDDLSHIAALNEPTWDEIGNLFSRFTQKLNLQPLEVEKAAMIVAEDIAQSIIDGIIEPYEGAKRIWLDVYLNANEPEDLEIFAGLAAEYEELTHTVEADEDPTVGEPAYEDLRELCVEEIVSAAKDLVLRF